MKKEKGGEGEEKEEGKGEERNTKGIEMNERREGRRRGTHERKSS